MKLALTVEATQGRARAGRLSTPRGEVRTPVFMPVGTQGTVKGMGPRELREVGAQIILGNTYHLYLRPGHRLVQELGGLHRFTGWDGPILTDSGGYQVFSLRGLSRVTETGVAFRSHLDGAPHLLTPELAIEVQVALGSDIMMPLDVLPPANGSRAVVEEAVARSLEWARRSRDARGGEARQALFGIIQGGTVPELRDRSTRETVALDLDGYAVGGLGVGESRTETLETVDRVTGGLPEDRPRYLMGMGTPLDLVDAAALGIDMFDCVLPTRNARNACAFTSEGRLNLRNARFRDDPGPLDPRCACYGCRQFCRAYLRHLVVAHELLAPVLLTLHNLRYFLDTMERIRQAIAARRLQELRREIAAIPGASRQS